MFCYEFCEAYYFLGRQYEALSYYEKGFECLLDGGMQVFVIYGEKSNHKYLPTIY